MPKKLQFDKCTYCRKDKKKCEPSNRQWPNEKCNRCKQMHRPCSAGSRAKAYPVAELSLGTYNKPVSQNPPGLTQEPSGPNKTVEESESESESESDTDDTSGSEKPNLPPGLNSGNTALHRAAWHGRYKALETRLRRGDNPNIEDYDGERPLQRAAWGGYTACAKLLLENGADIDHSRGLYGSALEMASSRGYTEFVCLLLDHKAKNKEPALHQAARKGHEAIVNLFIQARTDISYNTEDGFGYTVLHSAAASGNARVVKQILEAGGSDDIVEQDDSDETPLHCAASAGNIESFQLLLDEGADPFATSEYTGASVIHAAASAGHAEIVRLLLDEGADCNDPGDDSYATPLQVACATGKTDVVNLLLEHHADVNIVGDHHGTALIAAIEKDHFKIARQLIEHGADVDAKTKEKGTPVTVLQLASRKGCVDLVRAILNKSTDANDFPQTALSDALDSVICGKREKVEEISYHVRTKEWESSTKRKKVVWHDGHIQTVKFLIERGVDLERKATHSNRTPLNKVVQKYCQKGKYAWRRVGEDKLVDIIKLLLENGADVNTTGPRGASPLCKAAQSNLSIAQLLINSGANLNQQDSLGRTPLWWAAYMDRNDIVSLLLKSEADTSISDKAGKTVHRAATEPNKRRPYKGYWSKEIARLLLEHEQQNKRSIRPLSEAEPTLGDTRNLQLENSNWNEIFVQPTIMEWQFSPG